MNLDTFEKLQLNEVKELVKVYCVNVIIKYELLIISIYPYL